MPTIWYGVGVLIISVNVNDIAILNIRGVDERCIINGISNKEAVDLQQNADWNKTNWNIIQHITDENG